MNSDPPRSAALAAPYSTEGWAGAQDKWVGLAQSPP